MWGITVPKLIVTVKNIPKHKDDLGLLIPVPIDTAEQHFETFVGLEGFETREVKADNSEQTALFLPGPIAEPFEYGMVFSDGQGEAPADFYQRFDNKYTQASDDLRTYIAELIADSTDEAETVRRLVDYATSKFEYGSRNMGLESPQLICEIARGNCIDINTLLVSSLYSVGITTAYVAGYYFEGAIKPETTGMHCWVVTRIGGVDLYWDIAHHLKRDIRTVAPGLNPVPGARFAISRGRGLQFTVFPDAVVQTSHLIQPRWVQTGGKTDIASVKAVLTDPVWEVDPEAEAHSMKERWACKGKSTTPAASELPTETPELAKAS
jgi:hypothetical protein